MPTTLHPPVLVQNDGLPIPQIGLGIYGPDDDVAADAVVNALATGYRSIDTAAFYLNEAGVGEGLRRSGLPREEVHVTTKVWGDDHGYDEALAAFDRSLSSLGLEYVDLYLIHWPLPAKDRYVETWRALERILRDGRAKSIGVSNFQPHHLERLIADTEIRPVVNQIELHPGFQNEAVREFNAQQGILTQAWSPLGRGRVFENADLIKIAQKHSRSVAQIVIRWHVELGNVVIPKSVTPERMKENLNVFDFTLDEDDHKTIRNLETGARTGDNPDLFG
ncbi:aldo/keto reductase [Pseudarthrobacter sp. AL07]|uniref:aldo/keto reductase n=1 Tax=unclassified Pseudarthrobacter TaxID=2647000 RepID=UPI00249A007B|nr:MULTISPECIES: aldo/keto reductase [unclassified Pseudarthrobacter]MDI3195526.1 aldo/keto reductase [Pseudarthrobacter sp. AL20]MDI3209636.1 aldo/keto reductase [Pseudarthrobacter sp. AL07]